jgi:hypothetical protein
MPKNPGYNDRVFFNCPFDSEYMPLLRAIIFAIYRCGFSPKSSLEEDNGLDSRLDKITRLISLCKYGIHDISRTQLNGNGYPRFNMPFELGLFFGAKKLGDEEQRNKNALIFECTPYSYQQFLSDLNGIDTKAHEGEPLVALKCVREWLYTTSKRKTIPTLLALRNAFIEFEDNLPAISDEMGYEINNLPFNDFCKIVEDFIIAKEIRIK